MLAGIQFQRSSLPAPAWQPEGFAREALEELCWLRLWTRHALARLSDWAPTLRCCRFDLRQDVQQYRCWVKE